MDAAKEGWRGIRNPALAFTKARHALRVSELIDIRLTDLHLDERNTAKLNVRRLKGSLGGMHPIEGDWIDFAVLDRIRQTGEMRYHADWPQQPGAAPLADHAETVGLT